ncbi:MAG: enoyl-CoA hydratase/isomerase family protein, partial [Chlorobiales bacterium]|nr:enoyl-CoA hydratase/isomerase family protein [Chlorobiales bacterium]
YETKQRVLFLTLNRPEKRNALNPELVKELRDAFGKAETDENIRVVVLQSEGPAFCAGLDLDELGKISKMTALEKLADSENLAGLFRQIYTHKKLIISKVQGAAIAGGCGLAVLADIVVADREKASFCFTEVKIGFVPAIVGALILRRTRNAGVREMLLRGNRVTADEALRLGLVTHAVASTDLESTVAAIAEDICTNTSPSSVELTKQLLLGAETMALEDSINFAISLNAQARSSDDLKKGIRAFLNKEKISWK